MEKRKYLKLKKVSKIEYDVLTLDSNHKIGEMIIDTDGYFYFKDINRNSGYWAAYTLRELADILDSLNKDWNDEIEKYFRNSKNVI